MFPTIFPLISTLFNGTRGTASKNEAHIEVLIYRLEKLIKYTQRDDGSNELTE